VAVLVVVVFGDMKVFEMEDVLFCGKSSPLL
jgi:hypothetical protein